MTNSNSELINASIKPLRLTYFSLKKRIEKIELKKMLFININSNLINSLKTAQNYKKFVNTQKNKLNQIKAMGNNAARTLNAHAALFTPYPSHMNNQELEAEFNKL